MGGSLPHEDPINQSFGGPASPSSAWRAASVKMWRETKTLCEYYRSKYDQPRQRIRQPRRAIGPQLLVDLSAIGTSITSALSCHLYCTFNCVTLVPIQKGFPACGLLLSRAHCVTAGYAGVATARAPRVMVPMMLIHPQQMAESSKKVRTHLRQTVRENQGLCLTF